jgi:hypothetical protein
MKINVDTFFGTCRVVGYGRRYVRQTKFTTTFRGLFSTYLDWSFVLDLGDELSFLEIKNWLIENIRDKTLLIDTGKADDFAREIFPDLREAESLLVRFTNELDALAFRLTWGGIEMNIFQIIDWLPVDYPKDLYMRDVKRANKLARKISRNSLNKFV